MIEFPGFSASLAKTIAEFASAGCDSARLAAHLPGRASRRSIPRRLSRSGSRTRAPRPCDAARRLEIAAGRIAAEGPGAVRTVWFDGFHALPEPELRVIAALGETRARHHRSERFRGGGNPRTAWNASASPTEQLPSRRIRAATVLVKAPGIEREAEEIARRILAQAADGRAFREMGVIVRAAETYVPVLRSTFARFGIPARFYFDAKLDEHAAMRFLSGAVDAMLGRLGSRRHAGRSAPGAALRRFELRWTVSISRSASKFPTPAWKLCKLSPPTPSRCSG